MSEMDISEDGLRHEFSQGIFFFQNLKPPPLKAFHGNAELKYFPLGMSGAKKSNSGSMVTNLKCL